MALNSDDYTPQQYKKYNGQSVFKALSAIGSEASADELAHFISLDIGENEEIILPEVKQVLRRGVSNGFLVRKGQYYSFVGEEFIMQSDSAPRHRKRPSKRYTHQRATETYTDESEGVEMEEKEEDVEETHAHSSKVVRRAPVKLYESYRPPESDSEDDDDSDQYYEDEPRQKRIRLQQIRK